ncbi:oxalurate catabolism protein HpxZ [Phormidium sp. FACHB-592]|uniref:Oxalurate catabolism protein HpxZ n=1 Tax=Stenomitos frigidus AS-A4 TaxID=2933935 RepID=A0ABV0KGS8_9CYAN|nr:oxalurate catabolism protein HpxZ [Phormidium sp. FACHB-592]MBD2073756.1 oxalurate catabolism protein HpxZ [Phormidium sp. FACHB-592]
MPQINDPAIVTELTALYLTYEKALVENDLATLDNLFWDSPDVLRFGVTENLYGMEAIKAFRQGRSTKNLERDISNLKVVTFDADTAIVTLEFQRLNNNVLRAGRQSQVWRKLPQGWKIVSAHVSLLPG